MAAAKPDKPSVKSSYDVKLMTIDASKKVLLIKEIKGMLNLGLKEVIYIILTKSKEFVESAPVIIKKNVSKEEGDQMLKKFSELGAKLELV